MKEGRKEGRKKGRKVTSHPRITHALLPCCPAGSDSVMKWSESRAAAPKGRCPVEHREEFPDVLRGHISGLR